jgi:hypothetical protein
LTVRREEASARPQGVRGESRASASRGRLRHREARLGVDRLRPEPVHLLAAGADLVPYGARDRGLGPHAASIQQDEPPRPLRDQLLQVDDRVGLFSFPDTLETSRVLTPVTWAPTLGTVSAPPTYQAVATHPSVSLRGSCDIPLPGLPSRLLVRGHGAAPFVEGSEVCALRVGWPWRLPARAPSDTYVLILEHTIPQPTDSPPPKGPRSCSPECSGHA